MLIPIAKDEVRLGMYVNSLQGSGFKHPFWRTRFVLTDPADLEALRTSEVDGVVIDDAKGLTPTPAHRPEGGAGAPGPTASSTQRPEPPRPAPGVLKRPCSAADEMARAQKVAEQSVQAEQNIRVSRTR